LVLDTKENTMAILKDGEIVKNLVARPFKGKWFIYSRASRLGGVISIYRNLAKNYENSLRYEEADQFYNREMEIRRMYKEKGSKYVVFTKKNGWITRNFSLTGLFHNIFGYGLDYKKPIVLVIVLALIPIIYNIWLGNTTLTPDFSWKGAESVLNVSSSSLAKTFGIENKPWEGYFIGVITIPTVIAILIIAVKRKFQRTRE
jgi:hypothetical protein